MKTRMPSNSGTAEYLRKLPMIYAMSCWARYGVVGYRNSCKTDADGVPLVWVLDDGTATADEYRLIPITETTTAGVYCWGTDEKSLRLIADNLNLMRDYINDKTKEKEYVKE